jgi:hypothetical protein
MPRAEHPVPESLLTLIGDVVASHALLESIVQSVAATLIGQGQRVGEVVTVELSFRQLRGLVLSLYREARGMSGLAELERLMKRAGQIEEKRNQIVHSTWGAGVDKTIITRMKTTAKSELRYRFDQMSEADFRVLIDDIQILAGEVRNFEFYELLGMRRPD